MAVLAVTSDGLAGSTVQLETGSIVLRGLVALAQAIATGLWQGTKGR